MNEQRLQELRAERRFLAREKQRIAARIAELDEILRAMAS